MRLMLGLIAALLLGIALLAITTPWWLVAIGRWLAMPAALAPSDAIIVLGSGGLERALHGVELYQQGLAPQVWLTGDARFRRCRALLRGGLPATLR